MQNKGILMVISGFSGAGKGTLVKKLLSEYDNYALSISMTTRGPREGEQDGREYFFRTKEQFEENIAKNGFIEYAQYCGNYYGTPKAPVLEMLSKGQDVMFEIDTLGAEQIRKKYPKSITIFIMPPTFKELEKRLRGRGTESEEAIQRRLGLARSELAKYRLFDYMVFNDEVESAVSSVIAIIDAEKKYADYK